MQMFDVLNVKTYIDKKGQEQKSFNRCGILFLRPEKKGSSLKLDVQNMTGDYLIIPKKERQEQEQGQQQEQSQ